MILPLAALVIIGLHQVGCIKNKNDNNEDVILKMCTGLVLEVPKDSHDDSQSLYNTIVQKLRDIFTPGSQEIVREKKTNTGKLGFFRDPEEDDENRHYHCFGWFYTTPLSREDYDKIKEIEELIEKDICDEEEAAKNNVECKENSSLSGVMNKIKRAIKHMLSQRRHAYRHWVEVGNGVHKTDLVEYPADHLKKNLLKLIALKDKRNQ